MTDEELKSIESYLNKVFRLEEIVVKKRKSISDSCEIYLDDEFLGLIYKIYLHQCCLTLDVV